MILNYNFVIGVIPLSFLGQYPIYRYSKNCIGLYKKFSVQVFKIYEGYIFKAK